MQRDMDLIRELLLKLEALPMRPGGVVTIAPDAEEIVVPGYDHNQFGYHLSLRCRKVICSICVSVLPALSIRAGRGTLLRPISKCRFPSS